VGGVSAGLAHLEPQQIQLLANAPFIDMLKQLASPVCGTVVAVELILRFPGARSARIAAGYSARRDHLVLIGLIPVFLGSWPHTASPKCPSGTTRPPLAEVFLPGALRRLYRRCHLRHPICRARCSACARCPDLLQHPRAPHAQPDRPRQAVVRAPHRDAAQYRGLSPLRDFPTHP
jgi:hypothetical protein